MVPLAEPTIIRLSAVSGGFVRSVSFRGRMTQENVAKQAGVGASATRVHTTSKNILRDS